MTPLEYSQREARFRNVLDRYLELLPEDTLTDIIHYLHHAEIEMAVESLGLALITGEVAASLATVDELIDIGLALGLDKHSVFSSRFWNDLLNLQRHIANG